ncbi:hypothetical protein [Methylobacterium planeticum]|uniref:Integrase n=1 Tax=Methylobacterium planeticum TaxID=2615211 RepID=A0A6N6MT31_9HYPH|nr:hypothetical protein [Methylobacterium planeticum]KAB1073430.1 hypothetical protein F6X51_11855 [Methylobacterium planeticum]
MSGKYAIRQEGKGWTAYNTRTGEPVRLNGAAQVGLSREVAQEIVRTLQMLEPGPDKSVAG